MFSQTKHIYESLIELKREQVGNTSPAIEQAKKYVAYLKRVIKMEQANAEAERFDRDLIKAYGLLIGLQEQKLYNIKDDDSSKALVKVIKSLYLK